MIARLPRVLVHTGDTVRAGRRGARRSESQLTGLWVFQSWFPSGPHSLLSLSGLPIPYETQPEVRFRVGFGTFYGRQCVVLIDSLTLFIVSQGGGIPTILRFRGAGPALSSAAAPCGIDPRGDGAPDHPAESGGSSEVRCEPVRPSSTSSRTSFSVWGLRRHRFG